MTETILSVQQSEKTPCIWYGHRMTKHHWVDTVDGYQRCEHCKVVRENPKRILPPLDDEYKKEYEALAEGGYGWGMEGNGQFIAAELRCRERQLIEALSMLKGKS